MNKLVLTSILLISLNSYAECNQTVNWESIHKITEFGQTIDKDFTDPIELADAMVKFAELIPYVSPFATMMSSIIGIYKEDELAVIRDQVKGIETHLFRIGDQLNNLADQIDDTAIKAQFKAFQANIHNLELAQSGYLQTPNNATKRVLVVKCEENKMVEFAAFVERELTTEKNLPLKDLILRAADLRKLTSWSKGLSINLASALVLHATCLGVRIENNSTRNQTLSRDNEVFRNTSIVLTDFMRSGTAQIKTNYFEQAKVEINAYILDHQHESHADFSENLHDILGEKYYWRKWFVVSYDESVHNHRWAEGSHVYRSKGYGRIAYVSSTNNGLNFNRKLQQCINTNREDNWYDSSDNIYKDIEPCLKDYNGLGVVEHKKDLNHSGHPHTALIPIHTKNVYFLIVTVHYTYVAFAIAPEVST